jgi:NAD-dependent deacetylase
VADPTVLESLAMLIARSHHVVVLTGLQIGGPPDQEATSGRGEWADRASLEALLTNPSDFWDYYYPQALRIAGRVPGEAHDALARLQAAGLITAIITQAVDRLHRRAAPGATGEIVEVHGTVTVIRCGRCGERYGLPEAAALIAADADGVPRCTAPGCGFPLRPAGTLWGEPLIADAVTRAWDLAARADCFIVVDSELRTVPMSLLPSVPLTRGMPLAMIGEIQTQYDRYAEITARGPSTATLTALADLLAPRQIDPPEALGRENDGAQPG